MAKTETLHIRVNENIKANAEETLGMLGLSISEAVNIFLCQVNLTGGLPFEVKLPVPDRLMIHSRADIERKLDEAEEDIRAGKTATAEEVFSRLDEKHGV